MFFIFTVPLWVALIIWVICLIGNSKKAVTTDVPMVQRTVTAPDGRVVTMLVPANEPASVSIARLYPAAPSIPTGALPGVDYVNPRYANASRSA